MGFDDISQAGKVDYLLLRSRLLTEQKALLSEKLRDTQIAALIPFQQTIFEFEEARRRMENVDGQKSALALEKLVKDIAAAKDSLSGVKGTQEMNLAAQRLELLRNVLRVWFDFYALYDPKFAWWIDASYKKADGAVEAHAQFLHTTSGAGVTLESGGFGGSGGRGRRTRRRWWERRSKRSARQRWGTFRSGPAGGDALLEALHTAMIVYSPEQLVALANREFAWCDKEMLRASTEMGFGTDWKKAVEAVKNKYVDPGQMIYLVRDLSHEAIDFVEKQSWSPSPALVKEDYWEEAMTPRMQLVNPVLHRRRHHPGLVARQQPDPRSSEWKRCAATTCFSPAPRCSMS